MKKVLSRIKETINDILNFIKKHKKKVLIGLAVFIILFLPTFLYINLTNPTLINKYIASVANKGVPANNAFEDQIFYNAVVDAYNKENNANLPYTTNLTDEQLKTITEITYDGSNKEDSEKISSTKGIEKLTSLTTLHLSNNNLSNIDLSQNIALTYLDLSSNNLNTIDLSRNKELTSLNLDYNNLSSIDISKNTELTYLHLWYNNLSSIDISKNISLISLNLSSNNLSSIDISKNTKLTTLNLNYNNLSGIDISKNISLTSLGLYYNNLSSIDSSKNTKLITLDLRNNNLSSIDISQNTSLGSYYFSLFGNKLLRIIKLYDNIDISTVKNNISVQIVNQTYINFGKDRIINPTEDYKFYLNNKLVIKESVDVDTLIKNLGLKNITAKVYNKDNQLVENNVSNNDILKLYYDNEEIQSIPIHIFNNRYFDDENFYNVVVDAYNEENSTNLPYTTNLTDEQLKTIAKIDYSGLGEEDSEKIISAKGIEKLTSLTYLNLSDNNISNIDLSQNTELTYLNLDSNNLISIDLSNNTKLTFLRLSYNNLNSIDISKNTKLTYLNLNDNNLSSIDLNKNTSLTTFDLTMNSLGSIDLSQNKELTDLNLSYNNISSIDLSKNTLLTSLRLDSNNLSSIDLSKNTELTTLFLHNNPFDLGTYRMMLGTTVNKYNNIKLPEGSDRFYITYKIDNGDIAGYNNGVIKGLKAGTTGLNATLNGVRTSSSDMVVEGVIKIFDIKSSKYKIDKENKYIYTRTDTDNNTILKNITVENGTGKIENNEFKVMDEDVAVETYKIVNISSDKYDLSKDYIYTGYNSFNTDDIKIKNGSVEVSNNNINIKYNNEVLDSYKLVSYSSSKYNLDKEYIYVGTNEFSKDDISLINLTSTLSNNTLQIKYGNEVKASYKIVSISSNKYDLSKDYIYTGYNSFNSDDIKIKNGSVEVSNNNINIKYNNEVLDSYKLVSYSSSKYNLDKEYIYVGTNEFSKDDISLINLTATLSNNTLQIKYGNEVKASYKIVSISSNKYDLSKDNIRLKKDETFDIQSVNITNGQLEYRDNKLYVKYGNDVLKVYTITNRAKGDVNNDDKITVVDVSLLYRHVKKKSVITDSETLSISDINADNKITVTDVSMIYRYVKGKIDEL